ncbi:hypothetical protein A2U01_0064691, partial [Trifolium medium]|nr:hypothetical protein [Trifolium medium]
MWLTSPSMGSAEEVKEG